MKSDPKDTRTFIYIQAEKTAEHMPDKATIYCNVEATKRSSKEALAEVSQKRNTLKGILTKWETDNEDHDLKTFDTRLSSTPDYEHKGMGRKYKVTGYTARCGLKLEVNIDHAYALLGAAQEAGDDITVHSPDFFLSTHKEKRAELQKEAIQEAVEEAKLRAEAAGLTTDGLTVKEIGQSQAADNYASRSYRSMTAGAVGGKMLSRMAVAESVSLEEELGEPEPEPITMQVSIPMVFVL